MKKILILSCLALSFNYTYCADKESKSIKEDKKDKQAKEIKTVVVASMRFANFDIIMPLEYWTLHADGSYLKGNWKTLSLNIKNHRIWKAGLKEIFEKSTAEEWLLKKFNITNADELEQYRPLALDDISWFKQIDVKVGNKLEELHYKTIKAPFKVNINLSKEKEGFQKIRFRRDWKAINKMEEAKEDDNGDEEPDPNEISKDPLNPEIDFIPSGQYRKINLIIVTSKGWIDFFGEEPIQ